MHRDGVLLPKQGKHGMVLLPDTKGKGIRLLPNVRPRREFKVGLAPAPISNHELRGSGMARDFVNKLEALKIDSGKRGRRIIGKLF